MGIEVIADKAYRKVTKTQLIAKRTRLQARWAAITAKVDQLLIEKQEILDERDALLAIVEAIQDDA